MPDQHDENCEQAAAVAKKNMESTFCFGTDSPAMPKRVQKPAADPVQEPVASPATTARIRGDMRHKMLEGDDSAFAWEAGEPDDRMRNHAPLRPNPEIHVKGCDENRRANNSTHFTIGSDSPAATSPPPQQQQPESAESPGAEPIDQHDENCEQAAAVAKKNMESTFCFGTDSPAMPKRVQKPAADPVQEPVASPATTARIRGDMRHKMLEGDDSAFAWEAGEPDDRMRNHAPLRPNPEIHVKGCDENRRANNSTHFTIGSDSPAATPQLGSKIPTSIARRTHGTTKAEAARLATRLAVSSPHTMKQREMGEHVESFNSAAYNTASPAAPVHVGAAFKSNLVLGTSDSPMPTHETRAKASCVVNDSTEQNREALSSVYQNNKANFEKVTLEFC